MFLTSDKWIKIDYQINVVLFLLWIHTYMCIFTYICMYLYLYEYFHLNTYVCTYIVYFVNIGYAASISSHAMLLTDARMSFRCAHSSTTPIMTHKHKYIRVSIVLTLWFTISLLIHIFYTFFKAVDQHHNIHFSLLTCLLS